MASSDYDSLLAEYRRLKSNHSMAVQSLNALRVSATVAEYKELRDRADKTVADLDEARLKFERHNRVHPR
jgi:hypothetical protein